MALKHYEHQFRMANEYIIPLLKKEIRLNKDYSVLEVGCAESGVVKALHDIDINCIGIELLEGRILAAKKFNADLPLFQGDITDDKILDKFDKKFDLIIIRDVIEHIPDKEKAFENMSQLLNSGGYMYITFPPLYSPYAGHQQNGHGLIKFFLWIHLLPNSLIRVIGKLTNAHHSIINEIISNYSIGLTISTFTKIYTKTGFEPIRKDLFLSRPIFNIRWNWPVIRFAHIPVLKEILSTGCEYILRRK